MEGRKKVKEQQGVKKGVNVSRLGVSRMWREESGYKLQRGNDS